MAVFTKLSSFTKRFDHFDLGIVVAVVPLIVAGLVTMNSFSASNALFFKQIFWIFISLGVFLLFGLIDWRFLRRTEVLVGLFIAICVILALLFVIGSVFKGAQSWLNVGLFAIQPVDPAKLILIALLAKYFSRRHVEIAYIKHIVVSGVYALILFTLVFLQPDFGSAVILFLIWFGMVLVSGISLRHLLGVFFGGLAVLALLWTFVFHPYQKDRILTFFHPLADTKGAGYNAYQSVVAIGSGQWLGKGIGYGTQSKLRFLPEYETDFIFAAFAEEWGFVGVILLFSIFGFLIYRIIKNAKSGETNFEVLFGLGYAIFLMAHLVIHIGGNVGILPVTGTTLPFLSYGGSHLITEFMGLGILMGMRKYSRIHKEEMSYEFLGAEGV